MDIYCI